MLKIEARYKKLEPDRLEFLTEAVTSAQLTMPSLAPTTDDAAERSTASRIALNKPWQSIGSRGVRNLASKLLLTLFPPTGAFVRYEVTITAAEKAENKELLSEIENVLADRERQVARDLELQQLRAKIFSAIKLLLVTGNTLAYMPPSGGMRVYPLNSYVCRRDYVGNVLELIYVEILDRATLDPKYAKVMDDHDPMTGMDDEKKLDRPVKLFTRVMRKGRRLFATQEVGGFEVPDASFNVKVDDSPWLVLRFTAMDGEDYGRSFVEEFRGDLTSLERLRKSIVVASLNAAKLLPIIKPNSTITPRKFVEAANGEPLVGQPDDVTMLQQNKNADMSVAGQTSAELTAALSSAFLLNSSIQRQAERVTAEEIRRMAEELEDGLGGVYTLLSQDLQLPVARRIEAKLVREGKLEKLPPGTVEPTVITGLAAIGRGHELNRLREGMSIMAEVEQISPGANEYLQQGVLVKRVWTGVGVPTDDLLKSDNEVKQGRAAARQMQQQDSMREQAMKGASPHIGKIAAEKAGEAGQLDPENLAAMQAQMAGNSGPPAQPQGAGRTT